jgi:hypothetical protein
MIVPKVGDKWKVFVGKPFGGWFVGVLTSVAPYGTDKVSYTMCADWRHVDTDISLTADQYFPNYEPVNGLWMSEKNQKAHWELVESVADRDPSRLSFGERVTKALQSDSWSMIDKQYKR